MAQQLLLGSPRLEEVRECRRLLRVLPRAVQYDGPLVAETAQVNVVQQAAAYIDQLHRELLARFFPFAGDTRGVQTIVESLLPADFFAAALQQSPSSRCRDATARRSRKRAGRSQRKPKPMRTARPMRPTKRI